MMQLDEDTKQALTYKYKCYFGSIPERPSEPVLIVFDYRPEGSEHRLSIGFDLLMGSKCWMSEKNVKPIDGKIPNFGAYDGFKYQDQWFYGYSVMAFPQSDFDSLAAIEARCRRLYAHIVWTSQ
ncbi:MAG: hypothetical protein OXE82_16795 [Rhodobacter sp.]|nr:hypothetical protein [Rhodobacter sp.]